jgi:hypothetical protein
MNLINDLIGVVVGGGLILFFILILLIGVTQVMRRK